MILQQLLSDSLQRTLTWHDGLIIDLAVRMKSRSHGVNGVVTQPNKQPIEISPKRPGALRSQAVSLVLNAMTSLLTKGSRMWPTQLVTQILCLSEALW